MKRVLDRDESMLIPHPIGRINDPASQEKRQIRFQVTPENQNTCNTNNAFVN